MQAKNQASISRRNRTRQVLGFGVWCLSGTKKKRRESGRKRQVGVRSRKEERKVDGCEAKGRELSDSRVRCTTW